MTRRGLLYIISAMVLVQNAMARNAADDEAGTVTGAVMERNGQLMTVRMNMVPGRLDVTSNRVALLTPVIVKGQDSLALPSVGVYGGRRYYFYVRGGHSMLSGADEMSYRSADAPDTISYSRTVPFERWMNGSHLYVRRRDYGCCHTLLADGGTVEVRRFPLQPDYWEELPPFAFIRPKAVSVKTRELSGSAFIDFIVNTTDIRPEYRNNTAELAKITATIDSVRDDDDLTITSLSIKGFASPEGKYANNERLARGRTQALKEYVEKLYDFGEGTVVATHEAEDWQGLRRYVERSNLKHKGEIVNVIDSRMQPDAKEARIRADYPEDYRFLLEHCFPALRHSDYRIEYTVRQFSDVEEIKRLMKTQPGKLSLEEFQLAAQTMEPGSDEFYEVYDIAVRMYPDDATANLNAAYAAIGRRDMNRAAACLEKAGRSPEVVYAKGVYALLSGDEEKARTLLMEAERMGVKEAEKTLRLIDESKL